MKKHIIILFTLLSWQKYWAQNDLVLYNMPFIPQSHSVRPGIIPKPDSHVGLPFISSQQAGFFNTGFAPTDVLIFRSDDSINLRPGGLLAALRSRNFLGGFWGNDWASASVRLGKNYIYFSSTEVIQWTFSYPGDFMKLLTGGNAQFIGKEVNVGDFELDISHYRKQSLGYTRQITQKLNAGMRFNVLYGKLNIHSENNKLSLFTDPDDYTLRLKVGYSLNTSCLDSGIIRNPGKYWFNPDNRGFSFDFGSEYQLNKKIHLSASLLDLGSIKWKRAVKNYSSDGDISFTFQGLDVIEFANGQDSIKGIVRYVDSLREALTPKINYKSYSTRLYPRLFLHGSYALHKNHQVSFTYFQDFGRGLYNPYLMAGYFMKLTKFLQVYGCTGYGNRRITNLGIGLNVNLGNTQFYVVSDNIFPVFNPLKSQNFHLRAGINLISGFTKSEINYFDRDEDGVEDAKDGCPDFPGPILTNGCPDKDDDGISDKMDRCPAEKGPIWSRGCPDSDQDSIPDPDDSCMHMAGFLYTHGCPDTDFDSVPDDQDRCPEKSGLVAFMGCPDTDHDGIMDREDRCPEQAGGLLYKGCPDSDLDSLPDVDDKCPKLAGPVRLGGCPDKDGDGVSDPLDQCPEEFGLAVLQGCPSKDRDKDGVQDADDLCPDEPGSIADRGCPEKKKELFVPVKDPFLLLDSLSKLASKKIQFIYETDMLEAEGADYLSLLSKNLLRYPQFNLAILKRKNAPQWEITQAEKVKTILIENGISESRIRFTDKGRYGKFKHEVYPLK